MSINWETRLVWAVAPDPEAFAKDSQEDTNGSRLMRSVMSLGKERGHAAVYGIGNKEPDLGTTQASVYHEHWDPDLVNDIIEVAERVGFPVNELTYAAIKRVTKLV